MPDMVFHSMQGCERCCMLPDRLIRLDAAEQSISFTMTVLPFVFRSARITCMIDQRKRERRKGKARDSQDLHG